MYRLHTHEAHTLAVLVGAESELYLEEHYREAGRALLSLAASSASQFIDLGTCKAIAVDYKCWTVFASIQIEYLLMTV